MYAWILIASVFGFGGLAAWTWLVYVATWGQAALWLLAVVMAWFTSGAVAGFWFAWYTRRYVPDSWAKHKLFWVEMSIVRVLLGPMALGQAIWYFLARDRVLRICWWGRDRLSVLRRAV